ncbi:MAG: hypothetical protein M3Q47_08740 [Actinomycetota bacterium]|nr:hypothetical protein [Actinomycetota bacterium]
MNRVIGPSGWTPGKHMMTTVLNGDPPGADSLLDRVSVVRYAPRAIKLDRHWTRGVPDRWPAVGEYLRQTTGHSFPVLAHLRHRRAIRAIATMIKENCGESVIGRDDKLAAGLTYGRTVGDAALVEDLCALGATGLPDSPVQRLAGAICPSPAEVDHHVVQSPRGIPPAGIVELVTFISVLPMLHRLSSFYSTAAVERATSG